jgi:hypothetical protein
MAGLFFNSSCVSGCIVYKLPFKQRLAAIKKQPGRAAVFHAQPYRRKGNIPGHALGVALNKAVIAV